MKNYIKTGLLTLLLSMPALQCMEEQYSKLQPKLLEDLGLPNEIWAQILEYIYLDPNYFFNPAILDEAKDIYDGIKITEKYIEDRRANISLVCKIFQDLNISKDQWSKFKKQIRELYIPLLNKEFLKKYEGKEGLYPKGGQWHRKAKIRENIAQFLATGIISNNTMSKILRTNATFVAHLKLIDLLLFYGANPDLQDKYGGTALYIAATSHHPIEQNNIKVITLLFQYGANLNLKTSLGYTALYIAADHHDPSEQNNIEPIILLLQYNANPNSRDNSHQTALYNAVNKHDPINRDSIELIILLLQYGANPYTKNRRGSSAFDLANEKDFHEFPLLVRKHSQNKLKKICMLHILNNLPLYEDRLDTLPEELRHQINNLKS